MPESKRLERAANRRFADEGIEWGVVSKCSVEALRQERGGFFGKYY